MRRYTKAEKTDKAGALCGSVLITILIPFIGKASGWYRIPFKGLLSGLEE
jgi:hypothetical protein